MVELIQLGGVEGRQSLIQTSENPLRMSSRVLYMCYLYVKDYMKNYMGHHLSLTAVME